MSQQNSIVYIGRRLVGGKSGHAFVTPELIKQEEEIVPYIEQIASIFTFKSAKTFGGDIGGLYQVECELNEKGRITAMTGVPVWEKSAGFDDCHAAWWSYDRRAGLERARVRAEQNSRKHTRLGEGLQILRLAYHKTPAMDRRGFEFWLLDEVRKLP